MRYDFELMKRYKFEIIFITFVIIASCIVILINEIMDTKETNLGNYLWMPSAIMQSVAAIYALFVAIFVLNIQNNQRIISLLGDKLKPPFKVVSIIVAATIYFNGLVLFIFGRYKPIELEVNILYYSSIFSLLVSLIAIVYFSFWMISTVGLNTYDEMLYNLSQSKNIEECYTSLNIYVGIEADCNTRLTNWNLKTEDEKKKFIEYFKLLLENGTSHMKTDLANFIRDIGDTRAGEQLIKNLNDNDERVRLSSAQALGVRGYVTAVQPLIEKLDDKSASVRESSVRSLGRIGDKSAVNPLIKMLDDQSKDVILNSELALGNIGDVKAVEPLIKKLSDKDVDIKEYAVKALGSIGDSRAIESITERLYDTNANIRICSQTALEEIQKRPVK